MTRKTNQLHEVVLQRSTGEEQAVSSVEAEEGLPPLRAEVLDVMRLIEDHVMPRLATEHELIRENELV